MPTRRVVAMDRRAVVSMRMRRIAAAGAVALALLLVPQTAYALFEPGAILGIVLLALVLYAGWFVVAVGVETLVYRRALEWPLKQAFVHSLLANIAGFVGWSLVSRLLGGVVGSLAESIMSRSVLLSMVLGGVVITLGMTAIEVGVLIALNRGFADRRWLIAVGTGVNLVTIGVPLILLGGVVPATRHLGSSRPRLSDDLRRTLPITSTGGIGNTTTGPFRADESWYVEWMRATGANSSQPLDITLMRDNVLYSRPVKRLRTIHFVPGQAKSRTETVRETGWFRLKVKTAGGWQVTVYRAARRPGQRGPAWRQ